MQTVILFPAGTSSSAHGGIDDSYALLDSQFWRERHVSIHRTGRGGIAAARNIGAAFATGDNLVFLEPIVFAALSAQCMAAKC
ncbi:hypothetical protein D3C77_356460 [compost metagenome]